MKIVYDPRHCDVLPGNSSLSFTMPTVSCGQCTTIFDPLPAEPFYFLLDINYVQDKEVNGEIVIDAVKSESILAINQYSIPNSVIDRVTVGSALILLSRPYHGYPAKVMNKIVSMIIDRHSALHPSQFVFMLPAAGKQAVPYLNIVDFTFFERMVGERRHKDNKRRIWQQRLDLLNNHTVPKNRFVCINRRGNVFRMACTAGLWDLRDRGLLTFLQDPRELAMSFDRPELALHEYFPELIDKFLTEVKPQLPRTWDVAFEPELSPTECIAPDGNEFLEEMLDSALCIVNETLMVDAPPQWHSEKTYKAISLMMPFIIVGQRHSLRALQDQGYRTFTPWINESYDDIAHAPDRLRAAVAEAVRIITMSNSEINEFLGNVKPILIYNFQHFHKRCDSFDNDVVVKLQAVLDKCTIDNP